MPREDGWPGAWCLTPAGIMPPGWGPAMMSPAAGVGVGGQDRSESLVWAMDGSEAALGVAIMAHLRCGQAPLSPGDSGCPVSFSSQLHLVPRGGELVVRAGDRHRRLLCLPALPHCAGHHLLQSHQTVSVYGSGPEGAPAGLGAPPTPPPNCGLFFSL